MEKRGVEEAGGGDAEVKRKLSGKGGEDSQRRE